MQRDYRSLDFLIIGAGKSGTTSLAYYVDQHPEICITDPKEPWFFDTKDYAEGMDWYWERYLSAYAGERLVGEASSQTLFVPYTPSRLGETVPHARLIVILRDPVSRAYSDWWMKYSSGREPLTFQQAIESDLERVDKGIDFSDPADWQVHIDTYRQGDMAYRCYVDYGYYATQLKRYLRHFPREQLLVLTYDELAADPLKTTRRVWGFLGIAEEDMGVSVDLQAQQRARGRLDTSLRHRLRKLEWASPCRRG